MIRIVSLNPAATELLFALGAKDALIGVTKFCDYPEAVKEKKLVGKPLEPDYDLLEELRPDYVVVLDEQKRVKQECEKLGLQVVALKPTSSKEVFNGFITLGEKVGKADVARALVNKLKAKLYQHQMKIEKLPKKTVYIENAPIWLKELGAYVGADIISDEKEVEDANPQAMFVADIKKLNKSWDDIAAVKNQMVFQTPDVFSRPGPRVVEVVELIGSKIYPEFFSTFGSTMKLLDVYYEGIVPPDLKTAFEY